MKWRQVETLKRGNNHTIKSKKKSRWPEERMESNQDRQREKRRCEYGKRAESEAVRI